MLRSIDANQAARLATHLARYHADTLTEAGKRNYRWAHNARRTARELPPMVYHPLHPLTALAIGQRDGYPSYYAVLPWDNIYLSKDAEIRNPEQLLAGNFDLVFVLVYLVPLFIIAYSHNALAEERSSIPTPCCGCRPARCGRWRATAAVSLWAHAGRGVGAEQGGLFDKRGPGVAQLGWLGVSLLYVGFWYGWVYVLAALGRSAAFNALALLGLVVVLLVSPALNGGLVQRQTGPASGVGGSRKRYALGLAAAAPASHFLPAGPTVQRPALCAGARYVGAALSGLRSAS